MPGVPVPPATRGAVPQAILLTSHPRPGNGRCIPIRWGAETPQERGPVVATLHEADARNAIGSHAGAYAVYRALAIAAGQLAPGTVPISPTPRRRNASRTAIRPSSC